DSPGWENPAGDALVGPHPDGSTPGTWVALARDELPVGTDGTITVVRRALALEQPEVVEDEGPLDAASLPDLVEAPVDAAVSQVCVTADRDDHGDNDCADLSVPLRDVAAQLTVRLSGGATFLVASVETTESLAGEPVTLRWVPLHEGSPVDATPDALEFA